MSIAVRALTIGASLGVLILGSATAAAAQDAAAGEKVYAAQKCSICHNIAGKGAKTNTLDGVGKKLTADEIRQWIVNPVEMTKKTQSKAKPPMPNRFAKLPPADVDALVAYMQSLK